MAQITKETLINALYTHPSSDKEIGHNSAIIWILKTLIDTKDNLPNSDDAILKSAFDFHSITGHHKLSRSTITSIMSYAKSGHKLQAVKELKDASGLGLKESKDVIDRVFDLIKV
jgi:ribosomal protein L7/L12